MRQSTSWKRLAAAATVLALAAAPAWAAEIQFKKKDAKPEQQQAEQKDGEAAKKKSKPCPIDPSSQFTFNTLEDMFGFRGAVDSLALEKQQAAGKLAAEPQTATLAVEWRAVDESESKDDDSDKSTEKSKDDEKKTD